MELRTGRSESVTGFTTASLTNTDRVRVVAGHDPTSGMVASWVRRAGLPAGYDGAVRPQAHRAGSGPERMTGRVTARSVPGVVERSR